MAVVMILICAILSVLILIKAFVFVNRKGRVKLPPLGARAVPIVGHTFLLAFANRKQLYKIIFDTILGPCFKRGDNAAMLRIGTWDIFMILDPDDSYVLATTCLKKETATYGFLKPAIAEYGLFTADVPVWKIHRKLLNPTFNNNVLNSYLIEFNDRSRELVQNLMQEEGKEMFDPLVYTKKTILHIIMATTMGVGVNERILAEQLGKDIDIYTACVMERFTKFWYHSDFLYSFSNYKKQQEEIMNTFQKIACEILCTKKAKLLANKTTTNKFEESSRKHYKSLLDLLLEANENEVITETEILEEIYTFVGAGFDTTYHAVGMILLTLGSYPEVQKKVFDEQQEVFKGSDRNMEKEDLLKLKYLEAVIKETMRLYPPLPFVGRSVDTDLNFRNYTVPAGSKGFISIYHVCRHPVWGPDAEQFRPERWLDGSLPSDAAKAYAVFGMGKRNCIGSNFALMALKTILSHVVRKYRISGDIKQLVQVLGIVAIPASGHHICIEKRK